MFEFRIIENSGQVIPFWDTCQMYKVQSGMKIGGKKRGGAP
jgi:hypothetical protein